MKINKTLIIILFIIILTIMYIINFFYNPKYGGKDTVVLLGDGTFQIIKIKYDDQKCYLLYNVLENETLTFVEKYKIDKRKGEIYIIGKKHPSDLEDLYVVLNYKTGEYYNYNNLNKISTITRKIFEQEKEFKTFN